VSGSLASWRWGLSGPSRFLAKVADALVSSEGTVCVPLPPSVPDGALQALADRIRETTGTRVLISDAAGGVGQRGPAHWLAARAAVPPTGIRTAANFLDAPTLADVVFLVHGVPFGEWRQWALFLRLLKVERERAERLVAPGIAIVPPPGVQTGEIRAIFGRREFRWEGRVRRLDTELALQHAMGGPGDEDMAARTANATVVEIAGWDFRLLSELADQPLETRLEPLEHLRGMAADIPRMVATWENGRADVWEGRTYEHALSVMARGADTVIEERVWRAQVREVFPFLDTVRLGFIARHHDDLAKSLSSEPLVRTFRNGRTRTIQRPDEMEMAELYNRLEEMLPEPDRKFLRSCNWLRNRVAHLTPGPASTVIQLSDYWADNADRFPNPCHGWDWPRCGQRLTIMVGPSGGGKSTWAKANHPGDVVSSDDIRLEMFRTLENEGDQEPVFRKLRAEVLTRLASGRSAVIDATNLEVRQRIANARLAPEDFPVEYVVVDRPMEEKLATAGWRADRPWIIPKQAEQFAAGLDAILSGDGLPNVTVRNLIRHAEAGTPAEEVRAA
jgi:predicted kinase